MRLHYDPASTTSRAVTLFVAEDGIDVDLIYVGLAQGENHAEAFARLNPNRQVPVLEGEGLILTESAAILRYLAACTRSAAYPEDLQKRAIVDARLDWFNTSFARDAAYGLAYPVLMPHLLPTQAEAAAQATHRARQQTERWLDVLDRHWLGESAFVAGPALTIADYFGASYVSLLDLVDLDFGPYPAIRAWKDRMQRLTHWEECYAAFSGLVAAVRTRRPLAG